jgi:catechol 2,3-dioxygenase-like lactoylglutathione lyase family enzyme
LQARYALDPALVRKCRSEQPFMQPSALKTRITTPLFGETRDFYVRCLGMHVRQEWHEEDDVGCILAFPGERREALLEVHRGPAAGGFNGLSLQFRTEDLEGFRVLLPHGTQVGGPVERPWGSTYLYLTDPNGISIIVYEGGL